MAEVSAWMSANHIIDILDKDVYENGIEITAVQ